VKALRIKLAQEFEIDVFDNLDSLNHNKKTTIKEIEFLFEKGKADAEEQYSLLKNPNNQKFELKFDFEYYYSGGMGSSKAIAETGVG
jgi:hypothetical protein